MTHKMFIEGFDVRIQTTYLYPNTRRDLVSEKREMKSKAGSNQKIASIYDSNVFHLKNLDLKKMENMYFIYL